MSQFTISRTLSNPFQWLTAGLFALLLLVGTAVPAQAQMEDGELPEIDFAVNLMQSAQSISVDGFPGAVTGFHRARAGLNASVQFSENVSGLLMLEQEPNDFGGQFGLGPSVDFMVMNLQVSEGLTVQAGTPVTGLMHFRGFSDGPVVQGNPLIGNSPADIITAGQGVKLIGSYGGFGFDLTAAKTFGEDLTTLNEGNTGIWLIGNATYAVSDVLQVGAGLAGATGQETMDFARGDRENINLNPGQNGGFGDASKNTHAAIPNGGWITQIDAKITPSPLDVDLWGGFAQDTEVNNTDNDAAAIFGGLGAKVDVSERFYLAGRFVIVNDQGDAIDDASGDPDGNLTRFEGGIGVELYDHALLKVSGVTQSHGDAFNSAQVDGNGNSLPVTRPAGADSFAGVLTELSFSF
ncbi:hypothetical protein [Salinibacter altiplanensis]|uniref:hypothetical protein n=1 Tax=Salinibacter altiplanensis TaxID=1803181 RepID=UPI000C9F32B3|nr:hypothetical protein [Salinibacter altiplanensis]